MILYKQTDENLFIYVTKGLEELFRLLGIAAVERLKGVGVREGGGISKTQALITKAVKAGEKEVIKLYYDVQGWWKRKDKRIICWSKNRNII